jgi:hypothetical protein
MRTTLAVVVAVAAVPGCGGDSCKIDTTYNPAIVPTSFVAVVDNPMFPLTPGTRYEYQNGDEHVTTIVTSDHKVVLGVTCAVVHDTSMVNGELVEDTYDWYAQDRDGNVWYMGEDTSQLSGGKVTGHDGSWEAGIADAKPGIVMPAMRNLHQPYRQEYRPCEAEDQGEILATDATVTVPAGSDRWRILTEVSFGCAGERGPVRFRPEGGTSNEVSDTATRAVALKQTSVGHVPALYADAVWTRERIAGTAVDAHAASIVASFVVTGEAAEPLNFVVPSHPFDPSAGQIGAIALVAGAGDLALDGAAFPALADPATAMRRLRVVGGGVNWYLSRGVAVLTSYGHQSFRAAPGGMPRPDEDTLIARLQLVL